MEKPRIVRVERIYSGRRLSLERRFVEFHGEEHVREVVVFGSAVAILPILDNDKVILLEQYRAAVDSWVLEIPAGKIEDGETPEEAAMRELIEETGYRARYLKRIATLWLTPGYSDERIHIFLAKDLEYVGASPERGEIIKLKIMDIDSALQTLLSSETIDAKTLAALLLYRELSAKGMI